MNSNIDPTRCFSSQLTTILLRDFRNEQGSEEFWIYEEERRTSLPVYFGKVIITQIALCTLSIVATIETIAYSVLIIPSLIAYPLNSTLLNKVIPLFFSGSFTILWNVANASLYNIFQLNLISHESFARSAMDESNQTPFLRGILKTMIGTVFIIACMQGRMTNENALIEMCNLIDEFQSLRLQDRLFISNWAARHFPSGLEPANNTRLLRIYQFAIEGFKTASQIAEGSAFFKKYILDQSQMNVASMTAILENNPESYEFVLSRTIFLYAFDPILKEQNASFLKNRSLKEIKTLRYNQKNGETNENYDQKTIENVKKHVYDLTLFNQMPTNTKELTLFKRIKAIAYVELQGLFITSCWKT